MIMPSEIAELSQPFALSLYIIYDHPSDFPDWFIVRRFENDVAKEVVGKANTLAGARALIPFGLVNIHRHPSDDAKIVEVWI